MDKSKFACYSRIDVALKADIGNPDTTSNSSRGS